MGIFGKLFSRVAPRRGALSPTPGASLFSRAAPRRGMLSPTPGASLRMQAIWRSLPERKKIQLRRVLRDSDRDGVPDKFDCQPYNPFAQDQDSVIDVGKGWIRRDPKATFADETRAWHEQRAKDEVSDDTLARYHATRERLGEPRDTQMDQWLQEREDTKKKISELEGETNAMYDRWAQEDESEAENDAKIAQMNDEIDKIKARTAERVERIKRAKTPEEVDELQRSWNE